MSDFLSHLAARSLDLAAPSQAVQPRPAPLFEPPRPEGGALPAPEEAWSEGAQDGGRSAARTPEPAVRYPASAAAPPATWPQAGPPEPPAREEPRAAETAAGSPWRGPLSAVTAPVPRQEPSAAPPPAAAAPAAPAEPARATPPSIPLAAPPAPAPALLAAAGPPAVPGSPATPVVPVAPVAPIIERVLVERLAVPAEIRPALPLSSLAAAPAPESGEGEAARTTERVLIERTVARGEPVAPAATTRPAITAMTAGVPPVQAGPRAEPRTPPQPVFLPRVEPALPAAPPPAAAAGPVPTIQVTIGRIEVRATPRAAAPARHRAPAPSTPGLDDYLRQRNGRAGR